MKFTTKRNIRILKTITFGRFVNLLALKTSFFAAKYLKTNFIAKPYALSIELSAVCNLKCSECKISCGDINRENKFLDYERFLHLLNNIPSSIFYVNLYFQGESFLNKDIISIIKKLKTRGIYVCVSTNGNYKGISAEEIVYSGLDEIIFSIDGITQDEYQSYRRGGDLDLVLQNVKALCDFESYKKPITVMQTLAFKNTIENQKDIINFFYTTGIDILEFKSVQIYNKKELENIPLHTKYSRYNKKGESLNSLKKQRYCWRMWSSCVISSDLDVVICCFDKELQHKMGNLSKNTLMEIWGNKKYRNLRKSQSTFIAKTDICQNCDQGIKTNYSIES